MVIKGEILYDFLRFFGILIVKLTAGGTVNFILKMKRDMIICYDEEIFEDVILMFCGPSRWKELSKERSSKILPEFSSPSWWKELSKETGSEILPSGDGSHIETFKPIACLIMKGKLK
nr:hypothetical protein [Tanacetum cinerariifolium]